MKIAENKKINSLMKNIFSSREEYKKGEIPLNYEFQIDKYTFLSAKQNLKENLVEVKIAKKNQYIFDFSDLLPHGFRFVTPSTLLKAGEDLPPSWVGGGWGTPYGRQIVCVGDWRIPQQLALFLHEIGHSHNEPNEEERIIITKTQWGQASDEERKKFKTIILKNEKASWNFAEECFKKIRKETKIDLLKRIFSGKRNFDRIIKASVDTHQKVLDKV